MGAPKKLCLRFFVRSMLSAVFAELFEGQLFFEFFLVSLGVIVHFFANLALELDEIFLRHNNK